MQRCLTVSFDKQTNACVDDVTNVLVVCYCLQTLATWRESATLPRVPLRQAVLYYQGTARSPSGDSLAEQRVNCHSKRHVRCSVRAFTVYCSALFCSVVKTCTPSKFTVGFTVIYGFTVRN